MRKGAVILDKLSFLLKSLKNLKEKNLQTVYQQEYYQSLSVKKLLDQIKDFEGTQTSKQNIFLMRNFQQMRLQNYQKLLHPQKSKEGLMLVLPQDLKHILTPQKDQDSYSISHLTLVKIKLLYLIQVKNQQMKQHLKAFLTRIL